MNITEKSGRPVSLAPSTGEDDLIIITDKGMVIRTHLSDISVIGRDTQGVRVIKLNDGHLVSTIAIVPRQEESEEEDVIDETEMMNEKLRLLETMEIEDSEEQIEEENIDE